MRILTGLFFMFLLLLISPKGYTQCVDYYNIKAKLKLAMEKGDYSLALQQLKALRACAPNEEAAINNWYDKVFEAINQQREKALADRDAARKAYQEAEIARQKAYALAESSQTAALALNFHTKDPTFALRLAELAVKKDPTNKGAIQVLHNIISDPELPFYHKTFKHSSSIKGITDKGVLIDGGVEVTQQGSQQVDVDTASYAPLFQQRKPFNYWCLRQDTLLLNNVLALINKPDTAVFKGHIGEVTSIALSANKKMVLTGARDAQAILWNIDGEKILELKGHKGTIYAVAFSPDGQYLLTGGSDQDIKLWSRTGRLIHTFVGHKGYIRTLAVSQDNKYILSGGVDKSIKIWDFKGTLLKNLLGHKDEISFATFFPEGNMVLSVDTDDETIIWKLGGTLIRTFEGHVGAIEQLEVSTDGVYLLSQSADATERLWLIDNGLEIKGTQKANILKKNTFLEQDEKYADFSQDETYQLHIYSGKYVDLENQDDIILQSFEGHSGKVNAAIITPDNKYIITGGSDFKPRLWWSIDAFLKSDEIPSWESFMSE